MANQAEHLAALDQHERNKRIGDIPNFYGLPGKDTHTAKQIITRIEQAATPCNWDNAAKAQRLANALKGPAYSWYEGLKKSYDIDPADWAALKEMFLESYETLLTATALQGSLRDIQQKPNERISEYGARCQSVFNEYYDRYVTKAADTTKYTHANNNAANKELVEGAMARGAQRMMIFVQMSLYEAGLLEHIRAVVAQKQYETLRELQKAALSAEANHARKKSINAIHEDSEEAEVNAIENEDSLVELDDEAYASVCAFYSKQGKATPSHFRKRRNAPQQKKSNNGNYGYTKKKDAPECFWCGFKGHVIAECRKKKNGQPRNPKFGQAKVHEMQQEDDANVRTVYVKSLTANQSLNY